MSGRWVSGARQIPELVSIKLMSHYTAVPGYQFWYLRRAKDTHAPTSSPYSSLAHDSPRSLRRQVHLQHLHHARFEQSLG
jgi:hypothetical protein